MHALVICGMSASGKSTLAEKLQDHGFGKVITSTTRNKREGEVNAVDYHFLTRSSFDNALAMGEFVDHAEIHGNLYGSRLSDFQAIHDDQKTPILVCDPTGAKNLAEFSRHNPQFSFSTVFINLNSPDAAKRFMQRLDKDISGSDPLEIPDVISRNASRMSKTFHPDQEYCESLCREYLSGMPKVEGKLARLYQKQQEIAMRGKSAPCIEHQWIREYPYDLVIKEGVNHERQAGVIQRIKQLVNRKEDPRPSSSSHFSMSH